ncbi:MAG TPA: hypothetical protein VL098_00370 [Flavipsychrobacter sp.]|nr:hypothetical protein [Flavipsychrobacter sp.]
MSVAMLSGTLNSHLAGVNNLPENTTTSKLNELKVMALRNIKDMFTAEQYALLMKPLGKNPPAKSFAKSLNGGATLPAEAVNILAELLPD